MNGVIATGIACLHVLGLAAGDRDLFGQSVCAVGDQNDDGISDFVVSNPCAPEGGSEIWLFSGKDASVIRRIQSEEHLGWVMTPSSDADADGHTDLLAFSMASWRGHAPPAEAAAVVLSPRSGRVLLRMDCTSMGSGMASVGDVDGDGASDYLVGQRIVSGRDLRGRPAVPDLAPDTELLAVGNLLTGGYFVAMREGTVRLFSGTDGSLRFELDLCAGLPFRPSMKTSACDVGDLDGDGYPDVVLANVVPVPYRDSKCWSLQTGQVFAYSGKTDERLYRVDTRSDNECDYFRNDLAAVGDLDRDGVLDFAAADHGPSPEGVALYSGKDGALIRRLAGREHQHTAYSVAGLEDVDGDDVPEIVMGEYGPELAGVVRGNVQVFSGATGKRLFLIDRNAATPGDDTGGASGEGR